MSTRSGKRIHGSLHENTSKTEDEPITKTGRKTRGKRLKENCDENLPTTAKKRNYVTYPKSEDINENIISDNKSSTATPKVTLKEQNLNVSVTAEEHKQDVNPGKLTRQTRRTKRSIGISEDFAINVVVDEIPKNKKKSKKGKKKKSKTEPVVFENEVVPIAKKTKKKRGKEVENVTLNKSEGSVDSFHSAAGSPVQQQPFETDELPVVPTGKSPRRSSKRKPDKIDCDDETEERSAKKSKKVDTIHVDSEPNNLSGRKQSTDICDEKGAVVDKSMVVIEETLNTTFENEPKNKRKSSMKNATFDKSDTSILKLNSTYDKSDTLEKNNLTFEKDNKPKKRSLRSSTAIEELPETTLNNTFDKSKSSGQPSLNSTYEKQTKLNVTNEKVDSDYKKNSLISTDSSTNLTFDKSDCSRISITSDDSNVDNIINTTPVLIESSMDDSRKLDMSPKENNQDKSKLSMTPENLKAQAKPAATPLKREGTFTKDGPDVIIMSPKPKLSSERTPAKRMSLPSPGCTPFHLSKSSQKDKNALNLTHSIEKAGRRSSLLEPISRTTKVMFCSPVNNPALVMQQKRKVIKSNLKGSNKSFIFDESVSEQRVAPRKRSYTHSDAEEARAKRTRLAHSAQRLSRPRTASASASATVKPTEPSTPSKKQPPPKSVTPKSKVDSKPPRTKLPNFAALHKKQFERMESLDECQERKARRAKQLLTPTGAVTVLARSSSSPSARGPSITEPVKTLKDPAKKNDTPTKAPRISTKAVTQTKQAPSTQPKLPKLPTLESLRPGFTRFGFKMNTDVVNPFSILPKTETKPKQIKINGLMKRQLTQPSLNGATTRKEAAKQMVMREKSFTSFSDRRDVKRKENRTMIKGVRTNRRFELQMQMRNVNA